MKKVYVLEMKRDAGYFEMQKESFNNFWDNAPEDMKLKHRGAIDTVNEEFNSKIKQCNKHGCLWEGVIGRYTEAQLLEDGYERYAAENKLYPSLFCVVEAEVEDDATTWVGYKNGHLVKDVSARIIASFMPRFLNEEVINNG